jgi:membrane carboxypeptidase/penicillin-binding protein PbpC
MLSREPLQYETPQSKLPYVLDALRRTNSSTTHTSIDGYLTERVDRIAQSIRTDLQYRNVSDFGILIVDRETLQVRVLIGGADYFGKAGQVSAIFSPRQV